MNYTFAAVVILAASLFASSSLMVFGGAFDTSAQMTEPAGKPSAITGHVSLAIYDQSGNVKAYSQSGNTIVNSGENCISQELFIVDHGCALLDPDPNNGSAEGDRLRGFADNRVNLGDTRYTLVSVGTGTAIPDNAHGSVTGLVSASSTKEGTVSFTASTGTNPDAATSRSVTDITATFSPSATTIYTEAGLGNKNNAMFAYQDITDATVGSGGDLVITWSVSIG